MWYNSSAMTEEHKQHLRESALRRIAAMGEKKRAAYSARYKARWLHPTESIEAERRERSERAKRSYAALSGKEKRARMRNTIKANNVPVVATPIANHQPPTTSHQTFPSMKAAAWIVKALD